MLSNMSAGRRARVTSVATRDLLEPRRDPLGPRPWRCATCSGRRPTRCRRRRSHGRPELPLQRGRTPAGAGRRPVRALHPALRRRASTPIEDTAVEWSEARRAARAGRHAHDPAARRQHCRRAGAGARSSTRWPSTPGTPPTSSARSATSTAPARPSTTPARRTAWATAGPRSRRCATRARRGGAAGFQRCVNRFVEWHRLPAAAQPAQPRGASGTCCAQRNLIDTEPHEAPPSARPVPPAVRTSRRASAARSTAPPTTCPRRRWARSARRSGATSSRTTGRTCSTSRTRSLVSQRAASPRAVPAGAVAQPARGRLDPVPGARLGGPPPPAARRGRRRRAAAQAI